jgi:cyclic pyranopterin phosphate synthase
VDRNVAQKKTGRSKSGKQAGLTHFDDAGQPRMVDVGSKEVTSRIATAEGYLRVSPGTLAHLQAQTTPKGDPLVVAQIAGIQAAKRTSDLIPLCHPLPLSHVEVVVSVDSGCPGIHVEATTRVAATTGVEMEALTAVCVALLTAYDMLKAIDRTMVIEDVRLLRKTGGASGDWQAGA